MQMKTLTRKPLLALYALAAVLLIVAGVLWWNKKSTDPQNVFWGMVSQSLSTNSVTINAADTSTGASVSQAVEYQLGSRSVSHSFTTVTQGATVVKDEMLGTPEGDFTRYTSITTNQKSATGRTLDFTKILGVWARSTTTPIGKPSAELSQAILGSGLPFGGIVVPIGNLTEAQRAQLLGQIRGQNTYQVAFSTVKKASVNGRTQYTYDVTMQPILYASMVKRFAQDVGLHDLDQLDVNSFGSQQNIKVRLTVDVRSRQLVKASVGSGTAGISQTYTGYGMPVIVNTPHNVITAAELQSRLTAIQK
ncbi:MAG TPA: hypothetical protein VLH84_03320 [Patescibacteria group bacterium]|nr:hypothetical protein [Patescibacteria group bacterium]